MKKRKILIYFLIFLLLFLQLPLFFQEAPVEATWYDTDFNYRKLITINSSQIDSTLTNFPVLIYRNSDSDLSSNAQPDGDDIFFVLYSDNTTKLNHEIENYTSYGNLTAWVNVTSLSSTSDTKLWMYYGNPTCGSQENIIGTWNSNYVAVYHFDNNSFLDSTSNSYDAVNSGTENNLNGVAGGCRKFTDDAGENISVEPWADLGGDFTTEMWINNLAVLDEDYIRYLIQGEDWNSNSDWCVYGRIVSLNWRITQNASDGTGTSGGVHPGAGDFWYYIPVTFEGATYIKQYLNRTLGHNFAISTTNGDTYDYLTIGNVRSATGTNSFDGLMDEIRFSTVVRTGDWLNTTYETTFNTTAFHYVSGSEESYGGAPTLSGEIPADASTGIDIYPACNVTCNDPDGDSLTVYFYENTTGSWVLQQTNSSHTANTSAVWSNYTNASSYLTTYYWSVNVTDGALWVNETYSFTTKNSPPIFGTPSPTNGSTNQNLSFIWSIPINDTQGDTFNWTIQCSNGQSSEGAGQPPYNSPSLATSEYFSLKWERNISQLQLRATASSAVTEDVNGDGIEEVFIAGKKYPEVASNSSYPYVHLVCLNGSTGNEIWNTTYATNWEGSNVNQWCIMVYDFDKDGDYELTLSGGDQRQIMYNAFTGAEEWNTTNCTSGWHHQGYIDYEDYVLLYLISDDGLQKVWASNGTLIDSVPHYYECWGGVSIADIDEDGGYEIMVTDRSGSKSGYNRGLSVYDEDLNLEWKKEYVFCSTQCPMIADVDNDGQLEVVIGHQSGNTSKVYVFNGTGYQEHVSSSILGFHTQGAIGDIDNDGNLEIISCASTYTPKIYDLNTHTLEKILGTATYHSPDITNVIPDTGNTVYEILHTGDTGGGIYASIWQYNSTSGDYEKIYTFTHNTIWSYTADVDFDGYKEFLLCRTNSANQDNNRLFCYETNVSIPDPKPITSIDFSGLSRLNNDQFVQPPGYYEFDFYGENNGTKNLTLNGLGYSTTYTVWVNASDGNWTREWFTFTTKADPNNPPVFGSPSPSNNSINQNISFSWSIPISDLEGDSFNWSINCSNGQNSSANGAGNGTKTLSLSSLSYDTGYTVWVNATDSYNWTREWYNFTTKSLNQAPGFGTPDPVNGSTGQLLSLNWSIDINDADGDDFNWWINCSNGQSSSFEDSRYIGASATSQTGTQSFEDDVIGIPWNMTSGIDAQASNISIKIGLENTAHKVRCALYDGNKLLIAETEERTITTVGSTNWQSFNFSEPRPLLESNVAYYICAFINQTTGYASLAWDNDTGDDSGAYIQQEYGYDSNNGNFPDDWSSATVWGSQYGNPTVHMRCHYITVYNGTKTLNLTGLDYSTDYTVWVNATDSYNWTREWYTFETKANIPPGFGTPDPVNGSTGQLISFTWSIPINDADGHSFNWSINCSNGQTNNATSDSNGTKSLSLSGLLHLTNYTVWVNATDSYNWTREWYTFKTKANNPPNFGIPSPANNSVNQSTSLTWSIAINDADGHTFNWTIQCNNTQNSSANGAGNGTKTLSLSSLSYDTGYTVWVNATDSYNWTREWYNFTTRVANNPPNVSNIPVPGKYARNIPINLGYLKCYVEDPDGDLLNVSFYWGPNSTLIGTATNVGSGEYALVSITNRLYDRTYPWYVNITDDEGATTRSPASGCWYFKTESREDAGGVSGDGGGIAVEPPMKDDTVGAEPLLDTTILFALVGALVILIVGYVVYVSIENRRF